MRRIHIPSVMKLAGESLTEVYSPSTFLALYETYPEGCLVALDEEVRGFVIGIETYPGRGRILMLAVKKEFRRMGIGSMLLKSIMSHFAIRGISAVFLEVRVTNIDALGFYRAHGFEIKKIIPRFYTDNTDAYQLWRKL